MSRDYAKVAPEFWTGETGRAIKARGLEAQVVALYVLTSPHAKAIGIFRLPLAYLADDTGVPIEAASKALDALAEAGFCHFDRATEIVWVPEMARHQIGDALAVNDKRRTWVAKEAERVRKAPFFLAFARKYGAGYGIAFEDSEATVAPSMPHRSQELDQDEDPEQERGRSRAAKHTCSTSTDRTPAERSADAQRSERIRLGYLERFAREMPNIRPPAQAQPMSNGPWLELARVLGDEDVERLLDAAFADDFCRGKCSMKLGVLVSERVRLLDQGPTVNGASRAPKPLTKRTLATALGRAEAAYDAAQEALRKARETRDSLIGQPGHSEASSAYLRLQGELRIADDRLEAARRAEHAA